MIVQPPQVDSAIESTIVDGVESVNWPGHVTRIPRDCLRGARVGDVVRIGAHRAYLAEFAIEWFAYTAIRLDEQAPLRIGRALLYRIELRLFRWLWRHAMYHSPSTALGGPLWHNVTWPKHCAQCCH